MQCTEKNHAGDKSQVGGIQWSGSLFPPQAVEELSGFLKNYINCFLGLRPNIALLSPRPCLSQPYHLLGPGDQAANTRTLGGVLNPFLVLEMVVS